MAEEAQQTENSPVPDDQGMNLKQSPFPNDAYQVGWVSALPIELAAAHGMLDQDHGSPQTLPPKTDDNSYVLGQMHNHNVVIACLPRGEVGASSAALAAEKMMWSFPSIRFGLMVGIGAGIPKRTGGEDHEESDEDDEEDVHLGDVVISSDKKTGGVVAYNFGKKLADGSFEVAYHLDQPPRVLRAALSKFEATHEVRDNLIPQYINQMLQSLSAKMRSKWTHPGLEKDLLFPSSYTHPGGKTCKSCDLDKVIRKGAESREDNIPVIHYGVIATGSEVVRHAPTRDKIRSDHNAICLEMEAAGLMNNFPCLVIRGISDYADSHKNDRWHRYSAAAAAACAKEFLSIVQPVEVAENPRAAEIVGILDTIDSKLNDVNANISTLVTASQQESLRKWLSASNHETNFRAALGTYHPGTCAWFLEGDKFKDWRLTSGRHLWLHGIPGSGKTVMSSKIIDQLQSDKSNVLYFFFDTRDSEKQTLEDLLRSLIFQLYSQGHSARVLEEIFIDKFGEGKKRLFRQDLESTFSHMVQTSAAKFKVILDALDESASKEDVLVWVQSCISTPALEDISFLVTSRTDKMTESSIKRWLSEEQCLHLDTDAVNKDLGGYIKHCLQFGHNFERWRHHPLVLRRMEQELVKRADGMFRLVVCQLEILKSCIDIGQVEDEIKRLPRTLEGMYERILRDIREHHHTRVIRILQFLVYSQRPLRIDELVDAIAVDLSREPEFEPERRMPDPRGILEMCPNLVASRELNASKSHRDQEAGIVVEFIELSHATVKEYLISLEYGSPFYPIANPVKAQSIIAGVCLAYLSLMEDEDTQKTVEPRFPLAQFSSRYWLQYAAGSDELLEVQDASIKFLTDERTRRTWMSLYNPDFPRSESPSPYKVATPLYYAALGGLTHTVTKLLRMGADPMSADGGEYGNPLQAACASGQEAIVKILLQERGVDVNRTSGSLGTALQAASTQQNEEVINLLLERGAELQAQGGKYGNALQAASARGNPGVVRLLLDKGASPNLLGGKYNNALYVSCLRGHVQIVRYLLDTGADCDMEGPERGLPLQAAAEGNYVDIVQILIDSGADVNKTSGLYGCTLELACARGSRQVVQLLLDKGADPNQRGGLFGNALQAASARGDLSLVQLLLDNGADPNAWGGYFRTPIQAASASGHVDTMAALIRAGADVNAHDPDDEYSYETWDEFRHGENTRGKAEETPSTVNDDVGRFRAREIVTLKETGFQEESMFIQQLVADERKPIIDDESRNRGLQYVSIDTARDRVEMALLRRLDKARLRDKVHSNALQAAAAQGFELAVELLLEAGADVNVCQGIYGSPLQAASAQGHARIVKLLLDKGANANKLGGFYGTALQAASARGHDQVVKLLLDNWADPRREGGMFEAALPAAASRGHLLCVELLLQHSAYLTPKEEAFRRALYAASAIARTDIVKLLLSRGADTDVEEHWYASALSAAVKKGRCEIAKMLLDHGAGFNIRMSGSVDSDLLCTAARQGHEEIVKLFIESLEDPDMRADLCSRALAAASGGGHTGTFQILVAHGAKPNLHDDAQESALYAAVAGGHEHTVAMLLDLEAAVSHCELVQACRRGNEAIVRMLLRSPTMGTSAESCLDNPLLVAAENGYANLARLLLEADISPRPGVLQEFAFRGDVEMVKTILEAGGGIDEQFGKYGSALQAAARGSHAGMVTLLLQRGAHVDICGGEFGTALQAASYGGNSEIVDALLQAGADINVEGGSRGSALQAAASRGEEQLVTLFLALESQTIDTCRGKYGSALQAAAAENHLAVAHQLLNHGANVNMLGGKYGSALRAAICKGHVEMVELLLGSAAVVNTHGSNKTSSQSDSVVSVDLFQGALRGPRRNSTGPARIEHTPKSSQRSSLGADSEDELSSSHSSSMSDRSSYIEPADMCKQDCLWESGARSTSEVNEDVIDAYNPNCTTLGLALRRGNHAIIRLILATDASSKSWLTLREIEQGAAVLLKSGILEPLLDVEEDDRFLYALFLEAAGAGDEVAARELIQWADTHRVSVSYDKALFRAASHGQEQLAALFLEHGANPNAKSDRDTVFDAARRGGSESICLRLLEAGYDGLSNLDSLVFGTVVVDGFCRLLCAMLDANVGHTQKEENYASAFLSAAGSGKQHVMNIITEKAKQNSVSLDYQAALHAAAQGGQEMTMMYLLDQGAHFDIADPQSRQLLMHIMAKGNEHVAKLLVEESLHCDRQAKADVQILHVAAMIGLERIVRLLLEAGVDPGAPSATCENALIAAARGGRSNLLDLLISRVTEEQASWGGAVLQVASWHGNPQVVAKVLELGVDVNASGSKYGSALQAASSQGHKKTVEVLVNAGASVNTQGGVFENALQAAASRGHARITEFLLDNGADLKDVDGNGQNVLQAAARNKKTHVVNLLLRRGAEAIPQTGVYGSAIQAAASAGSVRTVKLLLAHGADVNATGGKYGSALHAAAYHARLGVIELLLKKGASSNIAVWQHGTPLQLAAQKGHLGAIHCLVENKVDVDAIDGQSGTALQTAARFSGLMTVDRLLDCGADVNIHSENAQYGSALQAACASGSIEKVWRLLGAGAMPDLQGGRLESALVAACMFGGEDMVELLLEHGADVNGHVPGGKLGSPLHAACFVGDGDVVELLLAHGADADFGFGDHGTALQVSCLSGHGEVTDILLQHGVNVNAKSGRLGTALQAAAWMNDKETVAMLLDQGASISEEGGFFGNALQAAAAGGPVLPVGIPDPLQQYESLIEAEHDEHDFEETWSVHTDDSSSRPVIRHVYQGEDDSSFSAETPGPGPIVRLLLDRGADIQTRGGHFDNALQAAAFSGDSEVVKILLESGANVNAKGGEFGTSLAAASYFGFTHVVLELLDAGADINAQSAPCGSPLMCASYKGHVDVVKILLERGADFELEEPTTADTPLIVATRKEHAQVVSMLIEAGAKLKRQE